MRVKMSSGSRKGPPKHQNQYAWKPNGSRKINPTEVGGKLRPYSEVTGVCLRCKEQIEWKRKYGKYKPLTEPAKCQRCSKRNVRQAHHNLCNSCAKEHSICAKCSCRVGNIVGRDISEIEAEQKKLEEAIKNARERDRRTLLRTMNRGNPCISKKSPANDDGEAGEASFEGHEELTGDSEDNDTDEDEAEVASSDKISE
ncbi:Hypothetical predicted protein [Olea europaea subsp. europaea]|uniref:Uncharacterized protein n=1 Tax=Olea europaea subsp. europaea TaxID=158383 RepID=A0A8S0VKU0_OLEEU|nr:Hypothetical predicted protein [Olea europaea subsp. europaea]